MNGPEVELALQAIEDGTFYDDHDRAVERCRALRAALSRPDTACDAHDAPVPAWAGHDAMAELLAQHPDSTDIRAIDGLGLSVGQFTVILARADAYNEVREAREAAGDPSKRRGRVPPLDDATRSLLQDLNRHVVSSIGKERAKRIMPMVGSYMAHAACGWGPLPDGDAVSSGPAGE